MRLTRAEIAACIPHGEPMCMLDEVVSFDEQKIECISRQLPRFDHPLEAYQQLAPELLIEYAAQAAAVHASLIQEGVGSRRAAYIGAIKEVKLVGTVENCQIPLTILAQCLLSSEQGAIYTVEVRQNRDIKLSGRLLLNQPV
ncbi:MAG: hypothetical protein ACI4NJ_10685 [Cellvibrio sp.]